MTAPARAHANRPGGARHPAEPQPVPGSAALICIAAGIVLGLLAAAALHGAMLHFIDARIWGEAP